MKKAIMISFSFIILLMLIISCGQMEENGTSELARSDTATVLIESSPTEMPDTDVEQEELLEEVSIPITGTRYMNVEGMLLLENDVVDYVQETENHVMHRVTPMFQGDKLVIDDVLIEAESVEDNGSGIQFNVSCYNIQSGIIIDYVTGDSAEDAGIATEATSMQESQP